MRALLICPARREAVAALLEAAPLVTMPILGKSLLEYWLEYLIERGVETVDVLAADRAAQVRALVEDGARWGLQVQVHAENQELSPAEARLKYVGEDRAGWVPAPDDAVLMDHLPGSALPLFSGYVDFFAALLEWMPHAATPDRIGMREVQPGIWVGLHSRISPKSQLRAPCWVGEDVYVGARAIVGPKAVVEGRTFVDCDAEIVESVVGASTLVGKFAEVRHSIATGSTLVNWQLNSCVRVHDAFLLSGLDKQGRFERGNLLGRLAALLALVVTSPFALGAALCCRQRGAPLFRALLAAQPRPVGSEPLPGDAMVYYELAGVSGLLRRWPQLWSIVRGEFAWVGNRPLTPQEAESLANDYDRLWLAAPIGLISLADAEGCSSWLSEEARAHASYYAAQAGWRLNLAVLLRTLFLLAVGTPWSRNANSQAAAQFLRNLRIEARTSYRNENPET